MSSKPLLRDHRGPVGVGDPCIRDFWNRSKGHPTGGSKGEERQHGVRDMGSVGRDEPDQSKEMNTEIAVEAA